ncbi:4-oxalomesaconate tautomerase [Streptomonospora wellingtoniae]|uniref:4-oxalomesaconate tautomerase n=1 Tax=Streptomonospora wellingtoniae TaxID=3075544 RepID=A0ABU2KUU8_9ACTN|nr:4-oxalomesaconate tautomerase [Streptomonospora sp. DSM 45055]MDT0303033.1 4-oxalomesaconate tautomerase [Streptomonospora sp. DSM 45055]
MSAVEDAGTGIRCMLVRGGTSKGAYFLAEDLPADPRLRDDLLLRIMGTPDPAQIDGIGGAQSVTSKVAIVSPAAGPDRDVDYLFLQLGVDEPTVSDRQTCGNLLAGVGQFAVERGLVDAGPERTSVRVRLVNTGSTSVAAFPTPGGRPAYSGSTAVSGVPGTAAAVSLDFAETEGAVCGALLPTGRIRDEIDGIAVTCVDNGMPVVVVRAEDLGVSGYEPVADLAADTALADRVQSLRMRAGELMGLGDVADSSVPKTTIVAAPRDGGAVCTRTFIPVRPHPSIGVLGGISAVTALMLDGAVGADLFAAPPPGAPVVIEHPSGTLAVEVELDRACSPPKVGRSAVVRTARKLFDGAVFPR